MIRIFPIARSLTYDQVLGAFIFDLIINEDISDCLETLEILFFTTFSFRDLEIFNNFKDIMEKKTLMTTVERNAII